MHSELQGCLEKSLKWLLINNQILLPNFLVFSCEWLGEFDIASKVTQGLIPHTPSIIVVTSFWICCHPEHHTLISQLKILTFSWCQSSHIDTHKQRNGTLNYSHGISSISPLGAVVAQLASAQLLEQEISGSILSDFPLICVAIALNTRKTEHWQRQGGKGHTVSFHWYQSLNWRN